MSSDKLDREMQKLKVVLENWNPKGSFDIPHDQLARLKQLEEHQERICKSE